MQKIGIICEYNPFHNGHLYHLNYIKKNFPDALIILVMSGEFTERADISILTKWEKTEIALHYGVNLVVELPFDFACQSADLFAYGAIRILNYLKVDKIIFGSESNNINKLKDLAKKQLDSNYYLDVKNYLKDGDNYPLAMAKALDDINFNTPNDILGLAYVREIIKNNYNIEPITIKRTNDYNSLDLNNNISSATAIREALKKNEDIKNYVPEKVYPYLQDNIPVLDNYFKYLKYRIINEQEDIIKYHGVDDKILPRIINNINDAFSFDELITKIKTKNYSYNRIKRMLIYILIGFKKDDMNKDINYIRILGFDNKGQEYLNKLKKEIDIPIITSYRNNKNNYLDINTKITNILLLENSKLKDEFKNHAINAYLVNK